MPYGVKESTEHGIVLERGVQGTPRVFVSHSSKDKPFVRRLLEDLKKQRLKIWFDERELKPGDSIVQGISEGLKASDYLMIVLSKASVQSKWVTAELNSALYSELSGKGTVVVPVLIEDCQIPMLLQDRIYADFRADYKTAYSKLISVFEQESVSVSSFIEERPSQSRCNSKLSKLTLAELRRLIREKMNRKEVSTIWFDTLEMVMDDDMSGRELVECIIEMLDRVRKRNILQKLIDNLCQERPDLVNP